MAGTVTVPEQMGERVCSASRHVYPSITDDFFDVLIRHRNDEFGVEIDLVTNESCSEYPPVNTIITEKDFIVERNTDLPPDCEKTTVPEMEGEHLFDPVVNPKHAELCQGDLTRVF